MTKAQKTKADKYLKQIEKLKDEIGLRRDKLRDICSELDDVRDTLNRADDDFDEGLRLFQNGLDAVSELL